MSYSQAKKKYAKIGVDTDKAIAALSAIPVSMHCWQGDDVTGFESAGGASNGIQTTGNYPGKATTPAELMADVEFAMSL
ncbi:MAG: L-rhamnose isomerase, partial [Kiritimatiellae bacterium]|nr:L-rhamnose isomerase [Kiritimatiellia bacterium]